VKQLAVGSWYFRSIIKKYYLREQAINKVPEDMSHNEYFDNAEEGQNKAIELVGYILPVP